MTRSLWIVAIVALVVGMVTSFLAVPHDAKLAEAATWQQLALPGRLSASHRFLERNCDSCHTSVKGVEGANCIVCHANNESLLQRQPTAFHAEVGTCGQCHTEHQGGPRPPTRMDHAALGKIGLHQLDGNRSAPDESHTRHERLVAWINQQESGHDDAAQHLRVTPLESALNCAACHSRKDRHVTLFGEDCAQCHAVAQWTIPEFRHPSPRSTDCAQCHQAPPSHYMGHFHMVSAKVAGKEHAQVSQCFLCHQTTAWNDIIGVGWYKHH